jgi:beta-galactosidase
MSRPVTFHAGTPAVTRNSFGAGHGWYVAAGLDQAGAGRVVRQVLDTHGTAGRYPELPAPESAARVAPGGTRLLFLLNHAAEPVEVPAGTGGLDLLAGGRMDPGRPFGPAAYGVRVLREND